MDLAPFRKRKGETDGQIKLFVLEKRGVSILYGKDGNTAGQAEKPACFVEGAYWRGDDNTERSHCILPRVRRVGGVDFGVASTDMGMLYASGFLLVKKKMSVGRVGRIWCKLGNLIQGLEWADWIWSNGLLLNLKWAEKSRNGSK